MNFRTEWFNAGEPYIHIYVYGFDLLPCFCFSSFLRFFFSLSYSVHSIFDLNTDSNTEFI